MADLVVYGLDLSLASTGMARIEGGSCAVRTLRPPKSLDGHRRLDWILRRVLAVQLEPPVVIAIEGPAYSLTTGSAHERAGLWWMVAHTLWMRGVPYVVIPPPNRAKYATGYGGGPNSGKDKVLAAVIRRYPSVLVDGNDQADALVLAKMTAEHYGLGVEQVPQQNKAALGGVKGWPACPEIADGAASQATAPSSVKPQEKGSSR